MNPADDASRGLDANKNRSSSKWFKGPEFLWHNESSLSAERTEAIADEDPEINHLLSVNRMAEKLWNAILFYRKNIWLEKSK